ncbi:WRKY domain - like 10, partial [Theobroma cacao]
MTEFSSQYHFATITISEIPICSKSMESMTSFRSSKYFLCFIYSDMILASSPEHVARSTFSLSRCAMFSCSFSSFLSLETFIQMTTSNILATSSWVANPSRNAGRSWTVLVHSDMVLGELPSDGCNWRKYGQKDILNARFP